jgi:hypothetical protein
VIARRVLATFAACAGLAVPSFASDNIVSTARTNSGESVVYLLTSKPGTPAFAVILMPGARGILDPRQEGTKIVMSAGSNFLIRSRELFADGRFVAASTDATSTPDRIMAIVRDLRARYGNIAVYVVGTSRSTEATMALAKSLDGQVAGFVHSSSMNAIGSFDPRGAKSRNLIVLHVKDACRSTNPSNGRASNQKFGTDLIEMNGGTSTGDDCEAYAYHGYSGIEKDTVDRIKAWITKQ